jgi:bifunctional non-homologous end joining protein LigD
MSSSLTSMRLLRIPEPFDHWSFVFEPKIDGFRALAYVRGGNCELVSRNGYPFKSWPSLCRDIARHIRAVSAVIDGEICCLEPDSRSDFRKLLFRRELPCFYAFDLLSVNGKDLRGLPLQSRKRRLRRITPKAETRLLYLDSIAERGRDLYRAACALDLEGVVGKWATGTYHTDGHCTSWVKIKNPECSQIEGRHELFEASRGLSKSRLPRLELRLA